ncbi:hypothetical protein BVRB_040090, partial [Beta vulgaris subsp. vulgaris]
ILHCEPFIMGTETAPEQGTWLPLECNPELISDYLCKLGVKEDEIQCADIYGIDPDLLQMVPSGVVAVLTLFPISDASEKHRRKEQTDIENNKLCQNVAFTVICVFEFMTNEP